MYTLFIQKKKGDNSPFPLTNQLNDFLKETKAEGIIIAPGHLSHSIKNINDLLDSILFGTSIKSFGILNRYGKNTITQYETYLIGKSILLEIDRNGNSDHSKAVFIFNFKNGVYKSEINASTYNDFLNEIDVIGVAIGSSNFSLNTYGNLSGTIPAFLKMKADKGESDILMFNNEEFKEQILDQLDNERIVLSNSISKVSNEFLKDMLRDELENSI